MFSSTSNDNNEDSKIFDISDLDPIKVIQSLFHHSKQVNWGLVAGPHAELTYEEATSIYEQHINSLHRIDYVHGRPMKLSLHDPKKVDMDDYDVRNGDGTAKAAFDAVRNGKVFPDLYNDSNDAAELFQLYLSLLNEGGPEVSDETKIDASIYLTQEDRPFFSSFNNQKNNSPSFIYLGRKKDFTEESIATAELLNFDKKLIEEAFSEGRNVYCEGSINPMEPSRNSIHHCLTYDGVKHCIDELKEQGSNYSIFSTESSLEKNPKLSKKTTL